MELSIVEIMGKGAGLYLVWLAGMLTVFGVLTFVFEKLGKTYGSSSKEKTRKNK